MKNPFRMLTTPGTSLLNAVTKLQKAFSTRKPYVLVACMPKSGSTFLTNALSELIGYKICSLCYAYSQTEQDLYLPKVLNNYSIANITQQHIRATDSNIDLIQKFSMQPIVLVRNIFDIIVSIRDHQYRESIKSPMFYLTEDFCSLDKPTQYDLIIELAIPWYINFFVSWHEACNQKKVDALWVTYEELTSDNIATLQRISNNLGINKPDQEVESTLIKVSTRNKNRLNKGISGRGHSELSEEQKNKVIALTRFYPNIDFSIIGIQLNNAL